MRGRMNNAPSRATLTPSDIAKLAGVSIAAVSNWRRRSEDFPQAVGGDEARPSYPRNDVIAWMRANDKPLPALGASSAISAFNLLREALPVDQAAALVVSLCAARKHSDQDRSNLPLWAAFTAQAGESGFVGLRELGRSYFGGFWDELISLPAEADHVSFADVQTIADMLSDIPGEELAEVADVVLERAVGALGRAGSEHGYIGNRVSNFLAAVSADDAHGTVYDPACGIADVLMQLESRHADQINSIGHEINDAALTMARQRAYLQDIDASFLLTDVLANDASPGLRANLIVADPPYGLRYEHYDLLDQRWIYGAPGKSSSELAWVQHAIAHLAEDGVAYVVTPPGPLFRSGPDSQIRRNLVAAGCVKAIYQLPPKLLQHTSLPLAVWVLGRPGTSTVVRFVVAESADVAGGRAGFEESNPSADVSVPDVLAGDSNLMPERWIGLDTPDPDTVIEVHYEAMTRLVAAEGSISALELGAFSPSSPARVWTIGDLVEQRVLKLRTGRARPNRGEEEDPRLVTGRDIVEARIGEAVADVMAISEWFDSRDLTEPGEILVSTIGKLAVALDESGGHLLATGVVGLRVRGNQLRPDYLAAVLDGKWNSRFFTGQTIQRVPVRELEVPILTLTDQAALAQLAANLQGLRKAAEQLQRAATEALESLAEVARYSSSGDSNQTNVSSRQSK